MDEQEIKEGDENMSRLEACRWLSETRNQHAFAGNRFDSNEAAVSFVQNLYQNGAREVIIDNIYQEKWRIRECGGPYADTLIILMTEEDLQRKNLIDIFQNEYSQSLAGFEGMVDDASGIIILWWD
jgi:hypothetical protein